MSKRWAFVVAALAIGAILLELLLVRAMARGHVAHVLLGAGNAAPPLGAALLAIALVVVRFVAVVVAPGALLASVTSVVAHVIRGPAGRAEKTASASSAGRRT